MNINYRDNDGDALNETQGRHYTRAKMNELTLNRNRHMIIIQDDVLPHKPFWCRAGGLRLTHLTKPTRSILFTIAIDI